MARMYPPTYPGNVWAEEQVFKSLERLPDSWHVIADAFFPVERKYRSTLDGQVDFILLHRDYGAIVLEVKGGDISVNDGVWTSRNRDGVHGIKDPFTQAKDYKYVLQQLVKQATGIDVWFMHGVAFPTATRIGGRLGTHSPDIVMFAGDLDDPYSAVDRMVAYHNPSPQRLEGSQIQRITATLAPTFTLERKLVEGVDAAKTEQLTLTHTQRVGFEMSRAMKRLWVTGGAGTGKTVLAVARAQELADDGKRVLLVCYNQPLGDHLRQQVADYPNVLAGSFHSIATRLAGGRPSGVDNDEWLAAGMATAMVYAQADGGESWDAVIVDEGQDFSLDWLEALEQMLTDTGDSRFILFSDENQTIFHGRGAVGLPQDPFVLRINCRNTPEINERACRAIDVVAETLRPSGLEPSLEVATGDIMKVVRSAVHRVVVDGQIPVEKVAVLSTSRPFIDSLQGTRVGRWDAVAVGERGLVCETVHRFKGLEADAVILVLPDEGPMSASLLYVGMTRARAVLTVVVGERAADKIVWDQT